MLTPFTTGFVDLQSPAGTVNSVLVYNYDGYVYASDESRMLAEIYDYTFRLGNVHDKYENIVYGKKVRNMAKVWANEALAGCADCALSNSVVPTLYAITPLKEICTDFGLHH